ILPRHQHRHLWQAEGCGVRRVAPRAMCASELAARRLPVNGLVVAAPAPLAVVHDCAWPEWRARLAPYRPMSDITLSSAVGRAAAFAVALVVVALIGWCPKRSPKL